MLEESLRKTGEPALKNRKDEGDAGPSVSLPPVIPNCSGNCISTTRAGVRWAESRSPLLVFTHVPNLNSGSGILPPYRIQGIGKIPPIENGFGTLGHLGTFLPRPRKNFSPLPIMLSKQLAYPVLLWRLQWVSQAWGGQLSG